jgi:hypothetical protein
MLIDAGATVEASTWESLIRAGASGMLHLLERKHVLPRTLPVLAALGDDEAVRAAPDESRERNDREEIDERIVIGRALVNACRFRHTSIALRLLDRAIALDPDLGRRIDRWRDRPAFVEFLIQHPAVWATERPATTPWQAFVIRQLTNALDHNDLLAFRRWLKNEPWVLQSSFVHVQVVLIERASYGKHREQFITALLEHGPALLRTQPPPSSAIDFALDYGNAHLIPVLTRIWSLPDDLPHAAGTGNAAAVAGWLDATGQPAVTQQVLDVALAWAILNHHFEIALLLLARGADINTNWGTHEAASILHEAAVQGNEDAARFLIDHGADLTKKDYRYQSNAEGWACYAAHDARMADLLAAAAAADRTP